MPRLPATVQGQHAERFATQTQGDRAQDSSLALDALRRGATLEDHTNSLFPLDEPETHTSTWTGAPTSAAACARA